MKTTVMKKLIACLVSVVMIFTLIPMTVFGIGENSSPVTVRSADGTETGYETLYEAVYAAKDGDTVLLNQNIEMQYFQLNGKQQKPTMVVEGKSLVLDGQGHTVTAKPEAFDMVVINKTGKLTLQNITMDGSSHENRRYSSILNIEGGEVTIEDGTILKNNATAAVDIGPNVPGGKCVMNGGMITENVIPAPWGSNDTGAAVTVLEEGTFIMNGGTISKNMTEKYGNSGIMVNRGGQAFLNGGVIEENTTSVAGKASAVHIQGGLVELNGTIIRNNTSVKGYGAVYVTNHSSFENKWDGILNIKSGEISGNKDASGNANAIYLWSKSGIEGTAAYIKFSGSPKVEGPSVIMANNSSSVDFAPLEVEDAFTPVVPVVLDLQFDYEVGQTIVTYPKGVSADSSHFIATVDNYGFQKNEEQNLLYTEEKRRVLFKDESGNTYNNLTYWEFVDDFVKEPKSEEIANPGYTIDGWFTDSGFTQKWNFETDKLPRESGDFTLYAKWTPLAAQAPVLPAETRTELPCGHKEGCNVSISFDEEDGYTYSYIWKNAKGEVVSNEKSFTAPSPLNGESDRYTVTVIAERTDNHQTAQADSVYIVSRAAHSIGDDWKTDKDTHWKECAVCGEKSEIAEHDFKWVIDKEASATEKGSKHEECEICGYKKAPVEIPATGSDDGNTGSPVTGHYDHIWIWVAMLSAASISMFGMTLYRRKRHN